MHEVLKNTDVLILCGGEGKRLQSITQGEPKPLAAIHGTPFLNILMDQALNWGAKRLILCVGYQQEKFTQAYQNSKYETAVDLVFSKEEKPLGTAGAIRNASAWIQTDPFLVLNGDSFLNLDFKAFLQFHKARASEISLAVTKVQDQKTYGSVVFDPKTFQITSFLEKNAQTKTPWINGGIYCDSGPANPFPAEYAFDEECDTIFAFIKDFNRYVKGGGIFGSKVEDDDVSMRYRYNDIKRWADIKKRQEKQALYPIHPRYPLHPDLWLLGLSPASKVHTMKVEEEATRKWIKENLNIAPAND